ncbi:hypothetical protein, partial [Gluconobacter cerinus]
YKSTADVDVPASFQSPTRVSAVEKGTSDYARLRHAMANRAASMVSPIVCSILIEGNHNV